jgi:hypothetical protein
VLNLGNTVINSTRKRTHNSPFRHEKRNDPHKPETNIGKTKLTKNDEAIGAVAYFPGYSVTTSRISQAFTCGMTNLWYGPSFPADRISVSLQAMS